MKSILKIIGLFAIMIVSLLVAIYFVIQVKKVETSVGIEEPFVKLSTSEEQIILSGEEMDSGEVVEGNTSGESENAEKKDDNSVKATDNTKKNEEKNNTGTQKLTSKSTYYIKVNNLQNVVTIYTKDEKGEYTVPYKAMLCSIGDATPTAGKSYKVTSYKKRWNALQGNVYGQYATQIVGNILFHSVPYTAAKNDSLEYWEYDKLGTAASLGCVRLTVQDAKWIYDNISSGTIVEFYEDTNPGPLGKPVVQKISNNEVCRNWDPTDTAEGNPWHNPSVEEVIPEIVEPIIQNSGESFLLEEVQESGDGTLQSGEEKENVVPAWLKVNKK